MVGGNSRALKGKQKSGTSTVKNSPSTLKIYLSRTPLDELLPKSSKTKSSVKPPVLPPKNSHLPLKILDQVDDGGKSSGFRKRLLSGVVAKKSS